ncbi:MAG: glycoside hydrolase family 15 protein [Actinomycetota bacterium]|nr:glycoside hydrolase family 15 protein [Actinomycetota bacterium]
MPSRIEDYAIIGDHHSAALVARDGSIDWLCLPRFDSGACFAALLGTPDHGRWQIAPAGGVERITRRYRPGTLILETEFHTADGAVRITDCMPLRDKAANVVRLVEGLHGRVPMRMELVIRFDYGSIVPWVRSEAEEGHLRAIAGPDALHLHAGVKTRGKDLKTLAEFEVSKGDRVPFVLTWHPSHEGTPHSIDAQEGIDETQRHWEEWSGRCEVGGEWDDAVVRSLITLKALQYSPTGGIVAAATTSLPERVGGVRNWDYRYCWLRDATFTLYSLLMAGFDEEARRWRDWLLRAVAGNVAELQIVYGPAGERRLTEMELPWLPGYEGSKPVRVGNAASRQFQLDVYGEVLDLLHQTRRHGIETAKPAWDFELAVLNFLESDWDQPDEGIWEVRGPRRHFTHSKVMVWVALDRAVKDVEEHGLSGPVDRWRALRDEVHDQVCREGYDAERGTFVQYYGSKELDANLLLIPLIGFLPGNDPRVVRTVEAIQRELVDDGFVMRYRGVEEVDGLPPGEGAFLPCTFWLVDALSLMGRTDEAREIFERLLGVRNDVGLLAEEYDPVAKRQVGNFPQAFSHVSLINTARNLSDRLGPAEHRRGGPPKKVRS